MRASVTRAGCCASAVIHRQSLQWKAEKRQPDGRFPAPHSQNLNRHDRTRGRLTLKDSGPRGTVSTDHLVSLTPKHPPCQFAFATGLGIGNRDKSLISALFDVFGGVATRKLSLVRQCRPFFARPRAHLCAFEHCRTMGVNCRGVKAHLRDWQYVFPNRQNWHAIDSFNSRDRSDRNSWRDYVEESDSSACFAREGHGKGQTQIAYSLT